MDQKLPVIGKKLWKIVRVAYLMMRKGLSKRKLMFDVNILTKRGKTVGKSTFHNLMHNTQSSSQDYYHFSCSNKHNHHATTIDVLTMNAAVLKALDMLQSETMSPALPGFGRTPTVRQLRVTDSPFPLRDADGDSSHVDDRAEEFISRFYKDLRREASGFA